MANPQSITVGANTYSLVPMPTSPAPKAITLTMTDTVARVASPFSQKVQTQVWPGADLWSAEVVLPPLYYAQARQWRAWLAQLRGIECVFQLGDPTGKTPLGMPSGVPLVNGAISAAATVLTTKGWTPGTTNLLAPGDYLQIGHRLHICLDSVASDVGGEASINVWPSIREPLADGTAIALANTAGLFRLNGNSRQVSLDVAQLAAISFKAVEVR